MVLSLPAGKENADGKTVSEREASRVDRKEKEAWGGKAAAARRASRRRLQAPWRQSAGS